MITEIVCAYYMRDEIVIDFTIFVFSERIDFTVLESSGAFVRSVLRFQRPKTSWGHLRGIRTIRRGSINGCRVGLTIPSCKQQLATCCRCDLRNFEQCGTVSRSWHLDLHLFICSVLCAFSQAGGDRWQLGFSSYYHVFYCFFDREKAACDNIYFLLSLYITQITWIV